jgi:ABC-type Fe3+/spermidine/putrescine transport system ATPase subunit
VVAGQGITVLINGRQEQCADKQTLYRHPANLAVARFLGIKNLFPATVVEAAGDHMEVDCASLGHRFRLPGQCPAGTAVHVGIRAEDIMLRDAEHPPRADDCLLEGTVQRIDMGANVAMHFQSPHLAAVIEIMATRRVADRFGIGNNPTQVTIALRPSAMFWIP